MTLRGYTRPKKGNKHGSSAGRHNPPRLDRDCFQNGFGRDFATYAASQAPRTPPDLRPCMRRAPGFNERGQFPGRPHGVRFEDEEELRERLAFMSMSPGYPQYPLPSQMPGMQHMPVGPFPYNSEYSGPPNACKTKCVTLRSKDFTDREVAAMYVAHLIKHGSEAWIFRFPEEEDTSSTSSGGPGPTAHDPTSGPRPRQGPNNACVREPKLGPFGCASKRDEVQE
ncbi:hypothetical protein EG329_008033 [Mollisiaceae sp. DMI_Dod_QoI]|nr:hypothetical protein EG329_008033 [Helotiales sp. DMI_Dod_QoI]